MLLRYQFINALMKVLPKATGYACNIGKNIPHNGMYRNKL